MRPQRLETLAGVSGTLVSGDFATRHLDTMFAGRLGEESRQLARRAIASAHSRSGARLGPASSLATIAGTGARPVFAALGFTLREEARDPGSRALLAVASDRSIEVPVVVTPWGDNLDRYWTVASKLATQSGSSWVLGYNGRALRLCDASRAWARVFLEFDLAGITSAPVSFRLFWALLRPAALAELTRGVAAESARHGVAVCTSLKHGVREALQVLVHALGDACRSAGRRAGDLVWANTLFDQALTIIYRVLFLLFAESRALVPVWHPVYRSSYTVESLRLQAERPGRHAGVWEGLQALSRLAHAGCRAGSLSVTPFNGRLFAPARAPLADGLRLDDELVARAIVALTTHRGPRGHETISFRDLGVEQLGAVYESVLDYEPHTVAVPGSARRSKGRVRVDLVAGRGRRKSSGTFYTPQAMTDDVVRHALTPLVDGRAPEDILSLRVLDPAMGSGAFLVSACRFLASAYEDALVRETGRVAADISDAERVEFRRIVARRCLYGVDVNPMAVQVARLSLWLATLAADRPLTFLDHHLAVGDSLVGASLDDLARQPPGRMRGRGSAGPLPLFPSEDADVVLGRVLPVRRQLEHVADDTVGAVREKERLVSELGSQATPIASLKRAADLWCATWFWNDPGSPAPDSREYADLAAVVMGGQAALPAHVVRDRLAAASRIARDRQFYHWTLEFPEVFYGADGAPRPAGGFDAVIGNPPWEMLRGDLGTEDERAGRRDAAAALTRFARESGIYPSCARGHVNQFQLFVERSLDLVRPGGRIGLIVPWGLASDHGCADLRRRLFDRCQTDRLVAFDNSAAIFPIHRGLRFLLLSTAKGGSTGRVRCRFGLREPCDLEPGPGGPAGVRSSASSVVLSRETLEEVAGPGLAVPHVRSRADLRLVRRLAAQFPALSDAGGWNVTFGRELNATDDRDSFTDVPGAVPVVDGKHVDPFVVNLAECRRWIRDPSAFDLTAPGLAWKRPRLSYRDVAASTNRLTLIAAILPPQTAAVHTLFCLKAPLPIRSQRMLSAVLNSLVANYVVRLWVTTHLGTTTVERLPAPCPAETPHEFERLVVLAQRLERGTWAGGNDYVELQARVFQLFRCSAGEVSLVLESFPLLDLEVRSRIRSSWVALERMAAGEVH